MATENNIQSFRGFLQSSDGIITKVFHSTEQSISFEAAFELSEELKQQVELPAESIASLTQQHDPFIFSERSRIARIGIQISCQDPRLGTIEDNRLRLSMVATRVIPGYPGLDIPKDFFDKGFPVGRLVYCDPEDLLSSDEVLAALKRGDLKLPDSTTISSDGTILIRPHSAICRLREDADKKILARILLEHDGREILNQYQYREEVDTVIIPPDQGIITTCSMYLNEHYVVLQSGFEFGKHLPATVLDPIKTRGVGIYLEIVNNSKNTIVNPVIRAKIYRARRHDSGKPKRGTAAQNTLSYPFLDTFQKRFKSIKNSTCHFVDRPLVVVQGRSSTLNKAPILLNGPDEPCQVSTINCSMVRRYASPQSACPHIFATARIKGLKQPATLIMKYFPNVVEHHDIIYLAGKKKIKAIYFYEPSCKYGPFLSDRDHNQLGEYYDLGIEVYWVSDLTGSLMVSTMRDGKGYFVRPERLADFHKSMLFAFYGSNQKLTREAAQRLNELIRALIDFWGRKNIGIITGGGSGVMQEANNVARKHGILSGANFLEITDQAMTTDVDFCQVFQSKCRHSRQKWFEVATFPIFNVGGLGSLEELGITLCNFKLSISERVPIVLFGTEGAEEFWQGAKDQILEMVALGRAPEWIKKYLILTSDPKVVVQAYKELLQLF